MMMMTDDDDDDRQWWWIISWKHYIKLLLAFYNKQNKKESTGKTE